ncbi:MAG: YgjV family protein [Pseudomonadota bacterium]|nr:YgjV family protein [Pseudomonadota bacterium]
MALTDPFVLAQVIGILVFISSKGALLISNDLHMKNTLCAVLALSSVQYILLGEWFAFLTVLCASLRFLASNYYRQDSIMVVFIALFALLGWFSYQTPMDVLPMLGCAIITYGAFKLSQDHLRFAFILSSICWGTYNFIIGAYAAGLSDCVTFIIVIAALMKNSCTPDTFFAKNPFKQLNFSFSNK